jgi:[acyl-carrier-protein] S-malonyltransferase
MSRQAVLLFAGQGSQRVGMGLDLAGKYACARETIADADRVLGMNLSEVMFAGPIETLTRTSYCQPALFAHGLACWRVLEQHLPTLEFAACAGLSLGEFTAHAAAGTFSFSSGIKLVAARGRFMDEACAKTSGAMAAMIGGEERAVRELATECDVDVANLNAPGQIVLSGSTEGISRAIAAAKSRGIRVAKPLDVAGAYHSRLMVSAQEKLAAELAHAAIVRPRVPVISNFTARPADEPADIRRTLEAQVTGAVRWSESMGWLRQQGYDLFIELGPGGVLTGLMARIDRQAAVFRVEDVTSLEETVKRLAHG